MDPMTKRLLGEVFGDPTNVAPSGTGAVLTNPSKLSQDLVSGIVKEMSMDQVFYETGRLVAGFLADEIERKGLRTADYASVEGVAKLLARRITRRIQSSETFVDGLFEGMTQRG